MKKFIYSGMIILSIIIFLIVICLPANLMLLASLLTEPEPEPEIKYGEFPIAITYEYEDEIITISETYVCKYVSSKPYRIWEGNIKNGTSNDFVLFNNDNITIKFLFGSPQYYMGDKNIEHYSSFKVYKEGRLVDVIGIKSAIITTEEMKNVEDYGIDIIEYNLPEPIENNFETTEHVDPRNLWSAVALIVLVVVIVIKEKRNRKSAGK